MADVSAQLVRARNIDDLEIELSIDGNVTNVRHFTEGGQYALAINGQTVGYTNIWSVNRAEYEWTEKWETEVFPVMLTIVRKYGLLKHKIHVTFRVSGVALINQEFQV